MKEGSVSDAGPRRWRVPTLSQRSRNPAIDDAGRTLQRLAHNTLAQVPHVIGACTTASLGGLARCGYSDDPQVIDRAWRFTYEEREVFCVLDEVSERALLGWIVGGAVQQRSSPIERNIIAEAMQRLLTTPGADQARDFREEQRVRPSPTDWRCELDLSARGRQKAQFALYTARIDEPPLAIASPPDLGEMTVSLRATFPSFGCALAELSAWRSGSLFFLRGPQRDLSIWLSAGGRRIAIAQLGAVLGERAAKLVALHAGAVL
jgi:hypothetical protein